VDPNSDARTTPTQIVCLFMPIGKWKLKGCSFCLGNYRHTMVIF
jgi:hypothetical protein